MQCPKCNNKMQSGEFEMHTPIWRFFLFGLSAKELYFKYNNKKIKTFAISDDKTGYYCEMCKTQIILGSEY